MTGATQIVREGRLLYHSEMASWYGTDIVLASAVDQERVGGYVSYTNGAEATCLFFTAGIDPVAMATVVFDTADYAKPLRIDIAERTLTELETDLHDIRTKALSLASTDPMFRNYENTNLNFIPIIIGAEKKVYVLTGPKEHNVVIFGNDYLITFDRKGEVKTKETLHKNIIPITYGAEATDGKEVVGTVHTHLKETGDYITATDVCTLMLYSKFAGWQTHTVVGPTYINIWNCNTNQLIVTSRKAFERINKNQQRKD